MDPVTPPQGANPEAAKGPETNPNPATPPAPPAATAGEKVSLEQKEYAQLLRDQARLRSLQRRADLGKAKNSPPADQNYGRNEEDPLLKDLEAARSQASTAEQQLRSEKLKNGVRDLLSKEEFTKLPESTKRIVLRNPQSLSDAQDVEEALLDIEDTLREYASEAAPKSPVGNQPTGHETPPAPTASRPGSTVTDNNLIDESKLTGDARIMASIHNSRVKSRLNR